MSGRKITRLDAIPGIPGFEAPAPIRKRVAAYARVSTELEEQQNSFEAQVDYYTKLIGSHPEWEFVKVYADAGRSGVSTGKRDGFREMIRDCEDGRMDLILTKSISRFARNTVDSLETIRSLKEKGIGVYFEISRINLKNI